MAFLETISVLRIRNLLLFLRALLRINYYLLFSICRSMWYFTREISSYDSGTKISVDSQLMLFAAWNVAHFVDLHWRRWVCVAEKLAKHGCWILWLCLNVMILWYNYNSYSTKQEEYRRSYRLHQLNNMYQEFV